MRRFVGGKVLKKKSLKMVVKTTTERSRSSSLSSDESDENDLPGEQKEGA
jgi:hypothetical protein